MIRDTVSNLIDGDATGADQWFEKQRPDDGTQLCSAARSGAAEVGAAIAAARRAQTEWAARTPVERGELVREIALALRARRAEAAEIVVAETGKPMELALGETDAAIEMGFFVAGEGRRLYGRTTTSAVPNRTVMATRRPVGVAALIVSFNTPLPNYAWKAFPAVFCGNTAVLKPSEHTPASAEFFGRLVNDVLPPGVLNVVQGLGSEAGPPLVESADVDLVSFTGSASTGRWIQEHAGAGWRRSASSSAARTRSSSATTRIWIARSSGPSPLPSPTRGSGVRPRAGSSSSMRCTTSSAIASWRARAATRAGR